ncbi:MAG TPA: HTTM domain-containing protein [Polyangiaceae bacterium]|nr:HTTM domain-containing protein [Polyangiaceae bacterium]
MVVGRLTEALNRPVDAASVAAFRMAFGAMLLISTLRFFAHGWVREFYGAPTHFFSYWGFAWVRPLSLPGMYLLYAVIAAAAACVMLGVASRAAAAVGALSFGYAHFCDKSNYLNHYYLITLLLALLAFLPVDREFSLRVFRRPGERKGQVRAWVLYLLRFQIGVVYVFGGLAKLNADWLLRAEPLRIWLSANAELPVIGRILNEPWAAFVFSWCGALFDLSIVPLLSLRATRAPAYALVLVFHVLTAQLFHIGMFPWIMIVNATIFWSPDWPRRLFARVLGQPGVLVEGVAGASLTLKMGWVAAIYMATQVLLPLRSALYPGNTRWSEEGFRFAWKVMLIEKAGSLEFEVEEHTGRRYSVSPRQYLTPFQARMASTQPDMILQLAHWIAHDCAARGAGPVRVYADSEVSFNGRRRQRMIDPGRDLATVSDGLAAKPWILPAPTDAPAF